MNIERRQKYSNQGRTSVFTKKRLPINFDLSSLNLMCNYVITENRNIRRSQYINLRNLIDLLDMDKYINDQEKYKRVVFIKKALEARLVKGLTTPIAIVKYVNGGLLDDDIINVDSFAGMSNQEIDWINETVANSLQSSFIYEEVDRALDLFTRFKAADYKQISSLFNESNQVSSMHHLSQTQSIPDAPMNPSLSSHGLNAIFSAAQRLESLSLPGVSQTTPP